MQSLDKVVKYVLGSRKLPSRLKAKFFAKSSIFNPFLGIFRRVHMIDTVSSGNVKQSIN